jgi:uncharacterized protein (TIGR03435 family)
MAARLVADHLWQSTLFAGAIWLLTRIVRRHRAGVRHALWTAASIKFLIPFAALIALGTSLGWTRAPLPPLRLAVDVAVQPFSPIRSVSAREGSLAIDTAANPWLNPDVEQATLLAVGAIWAIGVLVLLSRWTTRWLRVRRLVATGTELRDGREAAILRAVVMRAFDAPDGSADLGQSVVGRRRPAEGPEDSAPATDYRPLTTNQHPRIVCVDTTIEPGIVGILRPVLLWPASISARLDDAQIAAIFTHELAHVRRRDNLSATLHMAIEAVFWFHPLVWWLSARLVDERERACDEDVIRAGREPQRYAEGILRTCEFYLESPLSCVTGVTGADLKKRIETIMRNRPTESLGRARALLLSTFAVATIAIPVGVGVMRGPRLLAAQAPSGGGARFEAVSVKRNTSGAQGGTNGGSPGHYTATNISLRMLIRGAYGLLDSQIISGPALATAEYMTAEKFDIAATFPADATREQRNDMMQNMLKDRFKLAAHTEMREMPVYVLSLARPDGRLGPSLKPESEECAARRGGAGRPGGGAAPAGPAAGPAVAGRGAGRGADMTMATSVAGVRCGALQFGPGSFIARAAGLDMLRDSLSNRTPITGIDRVVLDRTGLTGRYDYELKWTPVGRGGGPAPIADDPERPSLFTALQEQLGLKLEPQRAPIEVLIIDNAAMPTEN